LNASSSDEITTLNLKGEIDIRNKWKHFPIPFFVLENEDVDISMEIKFSEGLFVHLEQKEH
jgi:hypothetical protein